MTASVRGISILQQTKERLTSKNLPLKSTETQREKRNGRNPQTGQSLDISARKVLRFSMSNLLKKEMNGL